MKNSGTLKLSKKKFLFKGTNSHFFVKQQEKMSLLVDTTSLVQPSISSLNHLQVSTILKDLSNSNSLLIDETATATSDLIGSYTSQPRTLTLQSASESIISISASGESESHSGSLEASGTNVNVKLYYLMSGFIVVSLFVGSL